MHYAVRKLILLVPALLGVALVVFVLMHITPGDPAELALGPDATPEAVAKLRAEWGLTDPFPVQYVRFVANAARGDFGRSYRTNRPVAREIYTAYPYTIQLATAGMLVALLLGVPAGIVSATRRYSIVDNLSMLLSLFGISMPIFWIGILLILAFSYYLGLLPTSGAGTLQHVVLPALTLGLASAALLARMTRSSMLDVLNEEYVRTARSKGLSERVVTYRHALRNAAIPVVTTFGLQFGLMLGGSVVVETVFAWPGLGRLVVTSILARDAPMVAGSVLLIATTFILVNLLVDLSYMVLDPRIKHG